MLQVGDTAPPFSLPDPSGDEVTLDDLLDGADLAVLFFYPFTFSSICDGELCSLGEQVPTSASARVRTAAISCDSRFVHRRWVAEEGYDVSVLSDRWPLGEVARSYGAFDEVSGAARRATFVVDRDRVVRWTTSSEMAQARNVAEQQRAIDELLAEAS